MKKTLLIFAITLLSSPVLVAQTAPKPSMVAIAGGSFTMGGTESDEKPTHTVTISGFSIGKYEVTVAEYKAFCTAAGHTLPKAPKWSRNDKHPIVNVSYDDANAYCNWLSKTTKLNYRLPTEAEWEYAARGGKQSTGTKWSGDKSINNVGWYNENGSNKTHSVGTKKPNELGLFDMSGNVWEWCKDWFGDYAATAQTNPSGATSGDFRILRGGSWYTSATNCRVAYRIGGSPAYHDDNVGFRVVLQQ